MPRAARRKREKEKELVETAKRMRKLTSFFSSAPAENVVDQNIDSRSNLTLPSATETPSTCLSPHSHSKPKFGDSDSTSSSEILVAPPTEPVHTPSQNLTYASLPSSTTTALLVGPMQIESTECLLGLDCKRLCCTGRQPYHPTLEEIKHTSRKQTSTGGSSNVRTCPSSIFLKYTWVTYCMTKGTIACYFCKRAMRQDLITFSHNGEKAFLLGEFSDWKKCREKLKKHSQSKFHAEATEKVLLSDDSRRDIGAILVSELKKTQETRRRMLLKQLSSIRYLARQAQSLQGKTELESNLQQLLKLRAEDVPDLLEWIDNGRYLSHDIINELINMMGNAVLRSIVADIRKESQLFSLIADESRDISNKEQLTCVLRWISRTDLSVHEDFLGMYELEKTDAETITTSLKDILLRCSLTIDDCRWQTYDGAANMAGGRSGVAARISSENPHALYIHCGNHSLDLALRDCVKESWIISDTLKEVQELAVFIRSSPTRMAQYQHIAKEIEDSGTQVENPHLLCPTRWTVRTKAISAVLHNYEGLYSALLSIAKESCKSTVRDTASGMASRLKKFSSYFGLSFAQNIFSVCEQVATTLQKPSITAQTTVTCINALKTNLQRQRDNFSLFYDQVVASSKAINFVGDPTQPRPKKVPWRLQHGDGEQHHFQTAKDAHRAQYVEAIDACLASLQERFDQKTYSVLMNIETVLINAANGRKFELNDEVEHLYENDLDFDQLKAELKLLEGIISQRLPEVKKVTSIDTITSIFSTEENNSSQIVMAMSNVVRLLQIYLLAPMSAASGERSFSCQRLVKTHLRSTMTAARYNNLIVMHVNKARTDELDLRLIAKDFVLKNERRVRFFGKF